MKDQLDVIEADLKEIQIWALSNNGPVRDFILDKLGSSLLALKELREQTEWQPIETAPKDGTKILAYNPKGEGYNGSSGEAKDCGGVCVARWENTGFNGASWYLPHCCDGVSYVNPTHWRSLPILLIGEE